MASSSPFPATACRIAATDQGPPPTITTSTSIASRSMSLLFRLFQSCELSTRVTCPPVTFRRTDPSGSKRQAGCILQVHLWLLRTSRQSARATPTTLKRPQFMPEALNSLPYDPALWAEAVAWQQECGVFDTLTAAPVDAIALRAAAKARPEVAKDATSRPEAQPATRAEAPAEIRAEIRVAAESTSAAAAPTPNAAPKPAAKTAPPAANQHGRRGLEAVADIAEAEKLAAACDSLEALQAAVEAFDGCLLKDTATTSLQTGKTRPTSASAVGRRRGPAGQAFVAAAGRCSTT